MPVVIIQFPANIRKWTMKKSGKKKKTQEALTTDAHAIKNGSNVPGSKHKGKGGLASISGGGHVSQSRPSSELLEHIGSMSQTSIYPEVALHEKEKRDRVEGKKKNEEEERSRPSFPSKRLREQFEATLSVKSKDTPLELESAKRFVESFKFFENPRDLLEKFTAPTSIGFQRLEDLYAMCNSYSAYENFFAPVLEFMFHHTLDLPIFQTRRDNLLLKLYSATMFLDTLCEIFTDSKNMDEALNHNPIIVINVCKLVTLFALKLMEARSSEGIQMIARSLRDYKVDGSEKLCNVVMIVDSIDAESACSSSFMSRISQFIGVKSAGWSTNVNLRLPGNRHDNDCINYRDICIAPTSDEVICTDIPYLPRADKRNRPEGLSDELYLLDSQFRLLREDFLFPLRESFLSARSHQIFKNAFPVEIFVPAKQWGNACIVFQFDSPMGKGKDRKAFWERFRGFHVDSLVSLTHGDNIVRFGTVVMSEVDKFWLLNEKGPRIGIGFDRDDDLWDVLSELGTSNRQPYGIVPASASFFSYKPILNCLQMMTSVPLKECLVDSDFSSQDRPTTLPSRVTLPTDFNSVSLDLDYDSLPAAIDQKLETETSLDESQREALYMALTHKVSLIQGPPGTGKTFIGSLIARVILQNSDCKILCVCYTNHALDQFLEYILDKEPQTKLVRLGGSVKITDRMKPYTLPSLARESRDGKSRAVKYSIYESMQALNNAESNIQRLQSIIKTDLSWKNVQEYLSAEVPEVHDQLVFRTIDEDGFEKVGADRKKLREDFFWNRWCKGELVRQSDQLEYSLGRMSLNPDPLTPKGPIWEYSLEQRQELLSNWKNEIFEKEFRQLASYFTTYLATKKQLRTLYDETKREVLNEARLIGATTSGAAKLHDLIEHTAADIVIVEEAGEILEAHVLSSLSTSTKQLILIGDHKQLRPKVECYDLTVVANKGFCLDKSLFERLILETDCPNTLLGVQHRMRPEISQIIRSMMYPELRDHPVSTKNRPNISGIGHFMAFIDHREPEGGDALKLSKSMPLDKSKVNLFEMEYCVELVRLILLQNYKQKDLVVLTPYLGQLKKIRAHMKTHLKEVNTLISDLDREELIREHMEDDEDEEALKSLGDGRKIQEVEGVRVSTVDNYQGEESDIVIISLVRSNSSGDIGFLKEPERVNVMLSRARNGMYIIGNSETFLMSKKGHNTWSPILEYFQGMNSFIDGIPSYCQNHQDDVKILRTPEDFRTLRQNGGCDLPCKFRMICGHRCTQRCHVVDSSHTSIKCYEKCQRIPDDCPHNHLCPKFCHQPCGDCEVKVNVELPCKDNVQAPCCQTISEARVEMIRCKARKKHTIPGCGHSIQTQCHVISSNSIQCTHKCGTVLSCEHVCEGQCGKCSERGSHESCAIDCPRTLDCGHQCPRPCHVGSPCESCNRKCERECSHSSCPDLCCKPCSPCIDNCDWICDHQGQCPLPCSAPCSRALCDLRCSKILDCGHQCPGVCGEKCPSHEFCQDCGSKGDQQVDFIEGLIYSSVDLNDNPIIFLRCGHFYTMSNMDSIFELNNVYGSEGISYDRPKSCPECRAVIGNIYRYGRAIKMLELNVLERKHSMDVDQRLRAAETEPVAKRQITLNSIRKVVVKSPKRVVFEACSHRSSGLFDPPIPPPDRLMRVYKALSTCYLELIDALKDDKDKAGKKKVSAEKLDSEKRKWEREAFKNVDKGLAIARDTQSVKSTAELTLIKVAIQRSLDDPPQTEIDDLCNSIIENEHPAVTEELKEKARKFKKPKGITDEERKEIMIAMSGVTDYGGFGINGHWYECPNGHEYYIGECGGAMEESNCAECGERVGGRGHNLLGTNRLSTRMRGEG